MHSAAGKTSALLSWCSSSFVENMKDEKETPSERRTDHARQHYPASPRATDNTRETISGVSRWRSDEQMASAEWFYRKGSPHGRQGRWHLQDVVYQLQHREEP